VCRGLFLSVCQSSFFGSFADQEKVFAAKRELKKKKKKTTEIISAPLKT
jgi:hypothetical protein